MAIQTKASGAWSSVGTTVSVNVAGTWKTALGIYLRVAGAWQAVGTLQKVSTPGVFSALPYGAPDGMTFTFQCSTPGATMEISTNGTSFGAGSVLAVPFGQTAYCRAYKGGWTTSDVYSVTP